MYNRIAIITIYMYDICINSMAATFICINVAARKYGSTSSYYKMADKSAAVQMLANIK